MSGSTSTRLGRLGPIERAVRVIGGVLLAIVALSLATSSSGFAAWCQRRFKPEQESPAEN